MADLTLEDLFDLILFNLDCIIDDIDVDLLSPVQLGGYLAVGYRDHPDICVIASCASYRGVARDEIDAAVADLAIFHFRMAVAIDEEVDTVNSAAYFIGIHRGASIYTDMPEGNDEIHIHIVENVDHAFGCLERIGDHTVPHASCFDISLGIRRQKSEEPDPLTVLLQHYVLGEDALAAGLVNQI